MIDEKQLLSSLDPSQFVPLLQKLSRNVRNANTKGCQISSFSRKQLLEVCAAVHRDVTSTIQELQAGNVEEADVVDALTTLRGAAMLAHDLLQTCHAQPPDDLLHAAMSLHDNALLALGDCVDVQDAVARLCSSWWEHEAAGKEQLAAQMFPYMLMRALATGRHADVKQCYALRTALELFDFDDASIEDTRRMLLRAALAPSFLHRSEGRRLLAYCHNLQPQLVRDFAAIIRNQVVSGRQSVLEAYGDVILRAWREATGACLWEVETATLQSLMEAAIRARSAPLAANLRAVLAQLHNSKREAGIDALLLRLYEPIMFRALAAANAAARRNALRLLIDVFPLVNPDLGELETDELLTRQFTALRDCLSDDCPAVRAEAAIGVCRVLSLFWEIIPAATTASLVSKLTNELAHDTAAPTVRAAVLEGLRVLIDSPHAQPVLKKALPSVSSLLSDPSARVREAMAALLVAVSTCRGLHFWEVVPVEQLLDALAHDAAPVAMQIQSILVPSYFPSAEEGLVRVSQLLRAKPAAGQAFCTHLARPFVDDGGSSSGRVAIVPIEHLLQLSCGLKQHLLSAGPQLVVSASLLSPGGNGPRRKAGKQSAGASTRGKKPAKASSGKRRKAASADTLATTTSDAQEPGGIEGAGPSSVQGDQAGAAVGEEDALVVEDAGETAESWSSLLAGLAEICCGLAGALASEQCTAQHVEAVFDCDDLVQLMDAAPRRTNARDDVLRIAAQLPFSKAAQALCHKLFANLSDSATLASMLSDGSSSGVATAAGQQQQRAGQEGHDVEEEQDVGRRWVRSAIGCLCAGNVGPKLVAVVLAALGVREAPPIRVPAPPPKSKTGSSKQGGAHPPLPSGDSDACVSCGASHPEATMMLCDGCETACHTACLRPPLEEVPEGDWLCDGCERQVQGSGLRAELAVRLVEVLLDMEAGRELLRSHQHFLTLLDGLRKHTEALRAKRLLILPVSGAGSSVSGVPLGRDEAAALAVATEPLAVAARVYCKAVLHSGLTLLHRGCIDDGEGAADGRTASPATAAESAEKARQLVTRELQCTAEWWDAAVAPPPSPGPSSSRQQDASAAALLPLQRLYIAMAVLGVLCDAQQLRLLDLPDYGEGRLAGGAGAVCDVAVLTVELCANVVEAGAGGEAAVRGAQEAIALVIALARHTAALPSGPAAGGRGAARATTLSQSLLLKNASERRVALGRLSAALLENLARPAMAAAATASRRELGELLADVFAARENVGGGLPPLQPRAMSAYGASTSVTPMVIGLGSSGVWCSELLVGLGRALISGAASLGVPSSPIRDALTAEAVEGNANDHQDGRDGTIGEADENAEPNVPPPPVAAAPPKGGGKRRSSSLGGKRKDVLAKGAAIGNVVVGGGDMPAAAVAAAWTGPQAVVLLGDGGGAAASLQLMLASLEQVQAGGGGIARHVADAARDAWLRGATEACCGAVAVLGLLGGAAGTRDISATAKQGRLDTPVYHALQRLLAEVDTTVAQGEEQHSGVSSATSYLQQLLRQLLPATA